MKNKKELSMLLSGLRSFERPDINLEQYQTDSEIVAESLWNAHLNKDIKGKIVADLGCGTGIFGLGAALLGAKKTYLVDVDAEALDIAKDNKKVLEKKLKKRLDVEFVNSEITDFKKKADLVVQNPPFGVKKTHQDKVFLMKAMEIAPKIYSFHKVESRDFIEKFVGESGFKANEIMDFKFPLKRSMIFHRKKTYLVNVGCWKIEKLIRKVK